MCCYKIQYMIIDGGGRFIIEVQHYHSVEILLILKI